MACLALVQDADVTAKYAAIHSRLHGLVCMSGVALHDAGLAGSVAYLSACLHQYLANQALNLLFHFRV